VTTEDTDAVTSTVTDAYNIAANAEALAARVRDLADFRRGRLTARKRDALIACRESLAAALTDIDQLVDEPA
jgi:hypothetical protein